MADIITNKINMTNNIFKSSLPFCNLIPFWKHIQNIFLKKEKKESTVTLKGSHIVLGTSARTWWPWSPNIHTIEATVKSFWHLRSFDKGTFFWCSCPEFAAISGWPGVFSVSWALWMRQGKESWSTSWGHWKDGHIFHHCGFPGLVAVVLRSFFISQN